MALALQHDYTSYKPINSYMNTETNSLRTFKNFSPSSTFSLNSYETIISSPDDIIEQTSENNYLLSSTESPELPKSTFQTNNWEIKSKSIYTNSLKETSYFSYINDYLNTNNLNEILLYKLINEVLEYNNYNKNSKNYNENIAIPPSWDTLNDVAEFLPELLSNGLNPYRFSPSVDEGLCIMFKKEDIIIYVEFYNDGDIGLIAENFKDKKVLINEDVAKEQLINKIKDIYKA